MIEEQCHNTGMARASSPAIRATSTRVTFSAPTIRACRWPSGFDTQSSARRRTGPTERSESCGRFTSTAKKTASLLCGKFFECAAAQVKLGPLWSPRLTFTVLRDEGNEFALNGLLQAVRASGHFKFFDWKIDTQNSHAHISGHIHAPSNAFVGLNYLNPPGGSKTCLNTKLASAEITLRRPGRPPRTLVTMHRAAFEILTDRDDHGVPIVF